jgi:AraC-like DNA-binding protein
VQAVATDSGVVSLKCHAPGQFQPAHSHDFDKVSFMLSGSLIERHGSVERKVEAGWTVVKPAGVTHEDWIGPNGLRTLTLVASPRGEASGAWRSLVQDYRWMPIERSVAKLLRLFADRVEYPATVIEKAVFALLASVTEAKLSNDDWYSKAITLLGETYTEPPSLTDLARQVSVHPVTLSRAFGKRGTSKSEIVHMCRARHAMRLIPRGGPVAMLAAELGFADSAHFARSFRHCTGLSPTEFRARFGQIR